MRVIRDNNQIEGITKMDVTLDTPQRVTLVIEKNKSDTWSLAAYLITADGRRDRRSLGVFETYNEATASLKRVWQRVSL